MTGIIYKHTNKINGRAYIGQTIYSLEIRLKGHLKESKNNPKYPFQRAIAKYGIENFTSEILEELPLCSSLNTKQTTLDEAEIRLIKKHKTHISENGYNVAIGGNAPMAGRKHSEESRKKISVSSKIKAKDQWENFAEEKKKEICSKMSESKKEYLSKEENYNKHIEQMRENGLFDMKGEKNPFYGKSHSKEKKEEIVKNRKNNNGGEYHPNGNRTAKKFKYISPEGEEFIVFNSSKKFCEEHNISVKIFQKFKGIVIPEPKIITDRTKSSRLNSVGWKRIEVI